MPAPSPFLPTWKSGETAQPPVHRTTPNPNPPRNPGPGSFPTFIPHRIPPPGTNPLRIAIIAGLILTFLVSLAAYPVLPDQIITHWNAAGVPYGSMGKLAGTGLVPLITVALVGLLLFLPRIDPLRENYAAFRDWYDGFILAFVLFMPAVQCQVILGSLGHRISMNLVMPVLVGLLFVYCGFFLERVEPDGVAGLPPTP